MTIAINDMTSWDEWLERCMAPVEPEDVGEDPRYSDRFTLLKAEVEKRQDVDFDLIASLATEVLTDEAKDLRAAGYFTMAASRLHGIEGFYQGIRLLEGLLKTFSDQCHPRKPKARRSALGWLQQPRVLSFIQNFDGDVSEEVYVAADQQFKGFIDVAREAGVEGFGWPDLSQWLAKQQPAPKAEEKTPAESQAQSQAASPTPATTAPSAPPLGDGGIQSEAQLLQAHKQLLGYYRDKQLYGAMAGLARSVKWGDLKLPPNEAGKTRVPAPRDQSVNKVRIACDNEDWLNAFLAAEEAFFEPGGAFCFELQRLSATAAAKAGHKGVALQIERFVCALFDRLPKLKQLSFDNGEPFVGGATQGWLEQIAPTGDGEGANDGADWLSEGRRLRDEENLGAALRWLHEQGQGSDVNGHRSRLIQAQLCHEGGQAALAEPMLERLDRSVQELGLDTLVPDLAMAIWRQRWMVLKDLKAEADKDSEDRLDEEIARLQSLMCATDLARAAQWF